MYEDMAEDEMKFQDEFMDMSIAMETYLAPVLNQLAPMLRYPYPPIRLLNSLTISL